MIIITIIQQHQYFLYSDVLFTEIQCGLPKSWAEPLGSLGSISQTKFSQ